MKISKETERLMGNIDDISFNKWGYMYVKTNEKSYFGFDEKGKPIITNGMMTVTSISNREISLLKNLKLETAAKKIYVAAMTRLTRTCLNQDFKPADN